MDSISGLDIKKLLTIFRELNNLDTAQDFFSVFVQLVLLYLVLVSKITVSRYQQRTDASEAALPPGGSVEH